MVDDDKFRISVQVSDEKEESLLVVLEWRNLAARQWETVHLIPGAPPRTEGTNKNGWWTTPELLNAPTDGSVVRYEIRVTDSDGNITTSDRLEYYPYVYPNLSVVQVKREDVIRYGYNPEKGQWYLSADVQVEGPEVQTPIEVVFFSGNPDVDEDMLVDSDARPIGTARIRPEDWIQRTPLESGLQTPPTEGTSTRKNVYEPDPLNTLPIATATLNLADQGLPLGTHDIFVYVDARGKESGLQTDQPGDILENEEDDNIAYRRISVNMGVVGTAARQIISLDRNCVVTAPPGVLQDGETVLSIRSLDKQRFAAIGTGPYDTSISPITDVSKRAPLPGQIAYGYELAVAEESSVKEVLMEQTASSLIADN